ncbi:MAG: DUF998 domain-containing protein [Nocardioides sp.]
METTQSNPGAAAPPSSGHRRFVGLAAWAGIAGPVLFTASFLTQEAFRRDEYDPVSEVVSALEAGPNGWVQQVTFVVFGALTMVHAVGLHRGMAPSRAGLVGPAFLFLSGVGSVVAGMLPLREDAAGVTYDPGGHLVGGTLFFIATPVAFLFLARRMGRDRSWRALTPYAVVAGVALIVSAIVMNVLVIPDDAALHDQAGLIQRLIVLVLIFPLRVALGFRLLSRSRAPR